MTTATSSRAFEGIIANALCLCFLGLVANQVCQYGKRWEFGPNCTPKALLAPDGVHYADGKEIEAFDLMIIRGGHEEHMWFGFGVVYAFIGLGAIVVVRERLRIRKEIEEFNRMLEGRSR